MMKNEKNSFQQMKWSLKRLNDWTLNKKKLDDERKKFFLLCSPFFNVCLMGKNEDAKQCTKRTRKIFQVSNLFSRLFFPVNHTKREKYAVLRAPKKCGDQSSRYRASETCDFSPSSSRDEATRQQTAVNVLFVRFDNSKIIDKTWRRVVAEVDGCCWNRWKLKVGRGEKCKMEK